VLNKRKARMLGGALDIVLEYSCLHSFTWSFHHEALVGLLAGFALVSGVGGLGSGEGHY
jgi:hypothetical protein